jgi:hypothetical protein
MKSVSAVPVPVDPSAPTPPQGGRAILTAFDKAAETRWDQALKIAKTVKGATVEDKVKEVTRMFTNELAVVGAAAGGVSSVAHFGAVSSIGAAAAELGWFSRRLADLVLTMAAVHGHTESSVEERRTWVVSVLAHGRTHAGELTTGDGPSIESNFSGQNAAMAIELLRQANRFLSHRLVIKWATKRGNVLIGRAIPFGIGATIGASANYAAVRNVARQADQYFRQLPPEAMPVKAAVSGRFYD